jgi:hypothetical protein
MQNYIQEYLKHINKQTSIKKWKKLYSVVTNTCYSVSILPLWFDMVFSAFSGVESAFYSIPFFALANTFHLHPGEEKFETIFKLPVFTTFIYDNIYPLDYNSEYYKKYIAFSSTQETESFFEKGGRMVPYLHANS